MSVRLSKIIGVMISLVFLFIGCEKSYVSDESDTSSRLNPDTISVPSGYAADALEVTGGMDAWTGAKKLQFDCVVTFYKSDESYYLTQQHYDVNPWSNAIEISGHEHESEYVWRFSNGTLSVIQGIGQDRKLLAELECSCFAQAILAITTAPVRLLDTSAQFDRRETAVKIEGQWYYPIEKTGERSDEAVFYQNRDSLLIDMIRVTCSGTNQSVAVRGYDYQKIEKEGPLVPARIEIFATGAGDVLQKRLVKIDCHTTVQAK